MCTSWSCWAAGSLTAIAPESAMGQDISWTRQFGTEGDDTAEDMVIDGAGNLYVVGSTDGPLAGQSHLGSQDAYLKKYDGQGNELWVRQFGTELWDSGAAVAMDGEGSLYVIGTTLGSHLARPASEAKMPTFANTTTAATRFGLVSLGPRVTTRPTT